MDVNVNIDVKELYEKLCPECKKLLEEMTEEDLSKQFSKTLAKQVLTGEKADEPKRRK